MGRWRTVRPGAGTGAAAAGGGRAAAAAGLGPGPGRGPEPEQRQGQPEEARRAPPPPGAPEGGPSPGRVGKRTSGPRKAFNERFWWLDDGMASVRLIKLSPA